MTPHMGVWKSNHQASIVELAKLAQSGKFDYLVIESSGISEPMQVAESFAAELNAAYMEMGEGIDEDAKKIIEGV